MPAKNTPTRTHLRKDAAKPARRPDPPWPEKPAKRFEGQALSIHFIIIPEVYIMKKTFKLEDLDCANCAAGMERGIQALDGVISATVNFMGMKLILEAEDAKWEEVLKAAQKVADKYDTTIVR